MKTRIGKWGNNLVLHIPKSLADQVGLEPDSPVELTIHNTELVISPAQQPTQLNDLLAKVTKNNRHGEADTSPAVGGELW